MRILKTVTDESGNYKYWQENVFAESQLVFFFFQPFLFQLLCFPGSFFLESNVGIFFGFGNTQLSFVVFRQQYSFHSPVLNPFFPFVKPQVAGG